MLLRTPICFVYEHCLDSNSQAQRLARTFVKEGVPVWILTESPQGEVADAITDLALDIGIDCHKVLFVAHEAKAEILNKMRFKMYFTGNQFDVAELTSQLKQTIACYLGPE